MAILDGMRRENATSGSGSKATEENEESVAPWNFECGPTLFSEGIWEVTMATGCAESRKTSFSAWLSVESRLVHTEDIKASKEVEGVCLSLYYFKAHTCQIRT